VSGAAFRLSLCLGRPTPPRPRMTAAIAPIISAGGTRQNVFRIDILFTYQGGPRPFRPSLAPLRLRFPRAVICEPSVGRRFTDGVHASCPVTTGRDFARHRRRTDDPLQTPSHRGVFPPGGGDPSEESSAAEAIPEPGLFPCARSLERWCVARDQGGRCYFVQDSLDFRHHPVVERHDRQRLGPPTIFNERHSLQPTSWLVPFDTLAA